LGNLAVVFCCLALIVMLIFLHDQGVRNMDDALVVLLPIVLSVLGWLGDHWFQLAVLLFMARVWIILEGVIDRLKGLSDTAGAIEWKMKDIEHKIPDADRAAFDEMMRRIGHLIEERDGNQPVS
jgi:hypothetical protein